MSCSFITSGPGLLMIKCIEVVFLHGYELSKHYYICGNCGDLMH